MPGSTRTPSRTRHKSLESPVHRNGARRVWREAARKRPGFMRNEHGTSLGSPPCSYGFRPGRSCQDAIEAIYDTCKGRGATRVWTLDADLAAAFDRLDHAHLMSAIGSFPGRGLIRGW